MTRPPAKAPARKPRAPRKPPAGPRVAVALGGGGARGLAHIAMLEAFDDLGVRPAMLAGASMGAVIGAAYAAGVSARELRKHVNALARAPGETMARVMRARAGSLFSLFSGGLSNPVLLDAEILLEQFWPDAVPATFAKLRIPLVVAATDFHARREAALSDGPLLSAVAGSMAIPGLMKPVSRDGHVLIDGGVTNPLPFDHLFGKADIVVALDVIGEPATAKDALPSSFEAMFGAAQIMQRALANRLIALKAPDLLFRPQIEAFRILDFFRAAQILEAGDAMKDAIKRALAARLEAA